LTLNPIQPAFQRMAICLIVTVLACARLAFADSGGAIDPDLGSPFFKRDRPVLGAETAPVVVIEVMSYKCAHCRRFHELVFPTIRERYITPGKVRWIMIPASEDQADSSLAIFKLGRCADEQGDFWKLLDFMFANGLRSSFALDGLLDKETSVDVAGIKECMTSFRVRQEVMGDFRELGSLLQTGLFQGTPTFYLRRKKPDGTFVEASVSGEQRLGYFSKVLDELLATP
jgi:protein-disulfide isomerase